MRRLLKWLLITLGIAALVRKVRSRRHGVEQTAESPVGAEPGDDPADELRRKLAETRDPEAEPTSEAASPEGSVEERRADVHAEGRAAIDEMHSTGGDE